MPFLKKKEQKKSNAKVLIIDQRDEEKLRDMSKVIHDFALKMRNSGFNIRRCISAFRDQESLKFLGLEGVTNRKYLLVDIFFKKGMDTIEQQNELNQCVDFIRNNGNRVIANKLYKDPNNPDNDVGKIVAAL